ncbi:heterokaryon incompatibility protein-domain-containing protein, partial [Hyaloscypha sp. PMI_1271]
VHVGENLYAALRTLREIPEIRNGARVWIDGLCIDQTNEDERSEQVKKMDRIYRGADRVISYLGSADNHANEVLQAMEMIGYGICDEEAADELHSWIQTHHDSPFFHYFSLLMSKGYWRRIWVMQELALARENSILICGMKRYDLVPGLLNRPMGTLLDGLARLKNISELRGLVETNKNRLQNFNTLWFRTAAENNATDPRDLVYGLLALLPAKLVQGVQIRYGTTTYQQVATDFTVNHIKTYNSLHWILFHPWHSFRDSQDWPSWMPNLGLPFNSAQFWSTIGGWQACS